MCQVPGTPGVKGSGLEYTMHRSNVAHLPRVSTFLKALKEKKNTNFYMDTTWVCPGVNWKVLVDV